MNTMLHQCEDVKGGGGVNVRAVGRLSVYGIFYGGKRLCTFLCSENAEGFYFLL